MSPLERAPSHSYNSISNGPLAQMSHQKQLSNDSSFVSYEVKEEGDFPLRSYSHELESHMVAPGTVIAEQCSPGNFTRILIPQPSTDPCDPLNWPSWLKHTALLISCAFVFFGTFASSGFSALLFPYAGFLRVPITQVALLTNYNVLTLGLCNFFWVPLALVFGKRPTLIAALSVLFGANIWGAYATTYNSVLGARLLQGFGGGAVEALGPTIVADLFFLHERGSKMSIYTFFLASGSSFGPIINGWIGEKLSLQWFWWLCTITSGANLLAAILLLPETNYKRNHLIDSTGDLHPIPNNSIYPNAGNMHGNRGMTFAKIIKFHAPSQPISSFLKIFLRPFPLIAVPAVLWAVLIYGNFLAWVVASDIQKSVFFPQPPYLMSLGETGSTSVASLLGIACGALAGGFVSDKIAQRSTRRNNGIREPEHRLPALLPAAIAAPIGCIVFGITFSRNTHWIGPLVGLFFQNFALACGPNVALTYVVDGYLPLAGEAMVTVNALKNLTAFGMSYGAVPWLMEAGWEKMWGSATGICGAVILLSVPMYVFGKAARRMTAEWRFIKV